MMNSHLELMLVTFFNTLVLQIQKNNLTKLIGSWLLIFVQMVPISLLVTLECVRFCQALLMIWDFRMFHIPTNIGAMVQTSNLNEELGQINVEKNT